MRNNYYKRQKLSFATLAVVASATGVLDHILKEKTKRTDRFHSSGIVSDGRGNTFGSPIVSELYIR